MHTKLNAADRFCLQIEGGGAARFISLAAASGIRLARVRVTENGCTLWAAGSDLPRLQAIAAKGAWRCRVVRRRGAGHILERLLRRSGLVCGAVLFFVLLQVLPRYVWCMDFGTLPAETQTAVRTLLDACGIREGTLLTDTLLQAAQASASRQSDTFGWISLNFVEGCLFVESTETQHQTVREQPAAASLYAKASGEILAVEADSGYAEVEAGQYVAAGQVLVSDTRLDRSGNPVQQGASGKIIARVQKTYTAQQLRKQSAQMLTGAQSETVTLFCLGYAHTLQEGGHFVQGERRTEWQPLTLGRIALPACLRYDTEYEQGECTQTFSVKTAQALALRACRSALLAEFPDAEIESESRETQSTGDAEQASVTYVFRADIAEQKS